MCTTLVVGRTRSATGHVLLAHSEELGRNSAHKVCVVGARQVARGERYPLHSGGDLEQTGRIARHLCTKIFDKRHYPGEHTSGINEHGVAVANNMAMMRGIPESSRYDVVLGGIIWTEFLQLVLERATSASEGVALVTALCERHGLSCDSGTMVAIADPEEAWWVELAREGHCAARRVEDDEVSARANCYRIDDFALAYGDPANQQDRYNLDRHDALADRVSGMATVGVADLMAVLRDVYEGTPLDCPRSDGAPFRTSRRTVARMNTEACTVLAPRRGLPPPLAHVMWCCLSTSLTGVFVPFHLGITRIEPHYGSAGARYDPASAYWLFTELAKLVDARYRACADLVRTTWREFEAETFRTLSDVEARCGGVGPAAERELSPQCRVWRLPRLRRRLPGSWGLEPVLDVVGLHQRPWLLGQLLAGPGPGRVVPGLPAASVSQRTACHLPAWAAADRSHALVTITDHGSTAVSADLGLERLSSTGRE